MTTIYQFLDERLCEDENIALRASQDTWTRKTELDGIYNGQMTVVFSGKKRVVSVGQVRPHHSGDLAAFNVMHIVHNQPERVLAEVAVKREILARHCQTTVRYVPTFDEFDSPTETVCRGCGEYIHRIYASFCSHLRLLASVYSDHADYDVNWAPR